MTKKIKEFNFNGAKRGARVSEADTRRFTMQVGDMVMVRDPYIRHDYQVPQAKIVEIKRDPVLLSNNYLLEFTNGVREWFGNYALKTQ